MAKTNSSKGGLSAEQCHALDEIERVLEVTAEAMDGAGDLITGVEAICDLEKVKGHTLGVRALCEQARRLADEGIEALRAFPDEPCSATAAPDRESKTAPLAAPGLKGMDDEAEHLDAIRRRLLDIADQVCAAGHNLESLNWFVTELVLNGNIDPRDARVLGAVELFGQDVAARLDAIKKSLEEARQNEAGSLRQ
jgi:hypothetical protein